MARELLIEEVEMDRNEGGKFLWLTHVFMRYVFYFFLAFFLFMILGIIIGGSDVDLPFFLDWGLILVPFSLPWFIETSILKFRKKFGFSKWGRIVDEYHLRVIQDRAIMEAMAVNRRNRNVKTSESKKGLDYWFELKQKGAISEEEYEKKKQELL